MIRIGAIDGRPNDPLVFLSAMRIEITSTGDYGYVKTLQPNTRPSCYRARRTTFYIQRRESSPANCTTQCAECSDSNAHEPQSRREMSENPRRLYRQASRETTP